MPRPIIRAMPEISTTVLNSSPRILTSDNLNDNIKRQAETIIDPNSIGLRYPQRIRKKLLTVEATIIPRARVIIT
jgi:hypothetical protein